MPYAENVVKILNKLLGRIPMPVIQITFNMEFPENLNRALREKWREFASSVAIPSSLEYEYVERIIRAWNTKPTPIFASITRFPINVIIRFVI